jgi:hypothetical protein
MHAAHSSSAEDTASYKSPPRNDVVGTNGHEGSKKNQDWNEE